MKTAILIAAAWMGVAWLVSPCEFADEDGFESICDGASLAGWDGNPDFWPVEDGAITGQTTRDKRTTGNTFIIWRQGELGDFELKAGYRICGGNSGIQYRSFEVPDQKWVINGYQADLAAGDTDEIQAAIMKEDWNDYHLTARGFSVVHRIAGVVACEATDRDEKICCATGLLAMQLHEGPPTKVQFHNVRLKKLDPTAAGRAAHVPAGG